MTVTLGAHNIKKPEKTQQVIPVKKAIPHPDYDPNAITNDIMLLKVRHLPAALALPHLAATHPIVTCPLLHPS